MSHAFVRGPLFRFRDGTAAEYAQHVQDNDRGEQHPDHLFEAPPAPLKIEVGANGDFIVHLGMGLSTGLVGDSARIYVPHRTHRSLSA
jgi:hypothetical protein